MNLRQQTHIAFRINGIVPEGAFSKRRAASSGLGLDRTALGSERDMSKPYVLYGSYASYYTAKVRAYMRKKGIPFTECLPSAPRFRDHVRPTSGSHRIPQLETPDGTVIQDSIGIVDYLEARHPDVPAFPATPRQRLAVHLMELFGSEGLVRLAWQFRWLFPDENLFFVKMDFGRSFRPQGSDEELMKYGSVIADRMLSRGDLTRDAVLLDAIKANFIGILKRFEAHFQHFPYLLGGHPSAADYACLGALHAHMGRDPMPLQVMQNHAPRVFRWVEHSLVPEIQSPEFFDTPVEYPPDDQLPQTFVDLLRDLADRYGAQFELNALAWAEHSKALADRPSGEPLAEPGGQPVLDPIEIMVQGKAATQECQLYHVWVTQRAQRFYASLDADGRASCGVLLDAVGLRPLIEATGARWLDRRDNRLVLA